MGNEQVPIAVNLDGGQLWVVKIALTLRLSLSLSWLFTYLYQNGPIQTITNGQRGIGLKQPIVVQDGNGDGKGWLWEQVFPHIKEDQFS